MAEMHWCSLAFKGTSSKLLDSLQVMLVTGWGMFHLPLHRTPMPWHIVILVTNTYFLDQTTHTHTMSDVSFMSTILPTRTCSAYFMKPGQVPGNTGPGHSSSTGQKLWSTSLWCSLSRLGSQSDTTPRTAIHLRRCEISSTTHHIDFSAWRGEEEPCNQSQRNDTLVWD